MRPSGPRSENYKDLRRKGPWFLGTTGEGCGLGFEGRADQSTWRAEKGHSSEGFIFGEPCFSLS